MEFDFNNNSEINIKLDNLNERLKKIETYLNNVNKIIHHGIVCDNCGMNPIKGTRYKCGHNCCKYNVCMMCEKKLLSIHNKNHLFIRIHDSSLAHIVDK